MQVNLKITVLFLIFINSIFNLKCIDETYGALSIFNSISLYKDKSLEGGTSCEKLFDKLVDSDAVLNQTCSGANTQCLTLNLSHGRYRGCFNDKVTNNDKYYDNSSCSESSLLTTGIKSQIDTCNTDNCNTVPQISCMQKDQIYYNDSEIKLYYINGLNVCDLVPNDAYYVNRNILDHENDVSYQCPSTPLTQYCYEIKVPNDESEKPFVRKGCTTSTYLETKLYMDAACNKMLTLDTCAGNNCNTSIDLAAVAAFLFYMYCYLPLFCLGTCITIISCFFCNCKSRTTNKSSSDIKKKKKKKSSSNSKKKKKKSSSSSNSSKKKKKKKSSS